MADDLRNRYRTLRKDYTSETIGGRPKRSPSSNTSATKKVEAVNNAQAPVLTDPGRSSFSSPLLKGSVVGIAVVGAGLLLFGRAHTNKNTPQTQDHTQTKTQSTAKKSTDLSGGTATLGASTGSVQPTQTPTNTASLPSGFHYNNDKQTSGGVTTYSIGDSANNSYSVVEEPVTANNTLASFSKSLTNTENLTVPSGNAVIGEDGSELLGGIQTPDGNLIIIGAPATSLRSELEALTKSL